MLFNSKLRFLLYPIGFVLVILLILILNSNQFLSKNSPINAKILVIEGWLPVNELENINKLVNLDDYQEIVITGLSHKVYYPDKLKYFNSVKQIKLPAKLKINSFLLIDNENINKLPPQDSILNLSIYASGTKLLSANANFYVFYNFALIGGAFADLVQKKFDYKIKLGGSSNKNLMIVYNNALYNKPSRRILTIDSISLNNEIVKTGIYLVKPCDIGESYYCYPFRSNAQSAASYLTSIGINKEFKVIDTLYDGRNKTFIGAEKLHSYLKQKYSSIPSINILSLDGHSRRSYISYKTALGKDVPIGIISFKNNVKMETAFQALNDKLSEYSKLFVSYIVFVFKK